MSESKLISIVIPVYEVEKYLERCLKSVIGQTYRNIEIIIVNDGSKDKSEEIIKKYQKKDKRIKVITHGENKGLFRARITGVRNATGDYISFVDSDDYIGIDYIRLLLQCSLENEADIVVGETVICQTGDKKYIHSFHDTELNILPLFGENIKNHFFEQAGACYGWHTVWNKLYKKELWDKSMPYLEKQDKHIVMTEDIIFSSVLLHFATSMFKTNNSVYYYCENEGSATDNKVLSLNSYRKKIGDINSVFDFVDDFLISVNETKRNRELFYKFRQYYARQWYSGLKQLTDGIEEAEKLLRSFCDDFGNNNYRDDNYFNIMKIPFNDKLEQIKQKICTGNYECISFDIFDTLICRPFAEPKDLFLLLDKIYEKSVKSYTSFQRIRVDSENGAREYRNRKEKITKDISIADIYEYIHKFYGISKELCDELMQQEKELEINFCMQRNIGKELFELAKFLGKKIIIVSDMYLDVTTIETILKKNGYVGYDELYISSDKGYLKGTGELFEYVIKNNDLLPDKFLHIGDNYYCDIEKSALMGMDNVYLPKAFDVYQNVVDGISTNNCYKMTEEVNPLLSGKGIENKSIGFKCMLAMVANKYFDNPFRYFHPKSDFNSDASFVGYYNMGMYLTGVLTWVIDKVKEKKCNRIIFMARDGFLLKKAYDYLYDNGITEIPSLYIYASRKAMLPLMVKEREDFNCLPIVYQQYTPNMILELLDFCTNKKSNEEAFDTLRKNFDMDKKFQSILEYHSFISMYMDNCYDFEKHRNNAKIVKNYFSMLKEGDIIFDTGYSASIHRAAVSSNGLNNINAVFIHSDSCKHYSMMRRGNFEVVELMDTYPVVSGLLREHLFSDLKGSCIGYRRENEEVIPIFEEVDKEYQDCFPVKQVQDNALKFFMDFFDIFKEWLEYIPFKIHETIIPFEGFLAKSKNIDRKMFAASYFEDKLYGANDKLNIEQFWTKELLKISREGTSAIDFKEIVLTGTSDKKKLALWGTGKTSKSIVLSYGSDFIDVFIDNDKSKEGKEFFGKNIITPEINSDLSDYFIVIACAAYSEIGKQLNEYGLIEYKDYVNYFEVL
ncbi:MAG: glycosyltransferase [Lachnospiraceae bacterium]|nr:glycosyltransferase [Lachnospiraceae bacterium]